jgi:hypothetical protein
MATIPPAVIATLDGYPQVGTPDLMIPLLTVDAAGYPHVCLLSRAELDADVNHVYAVIASTVTKANVVRDRRAALVVFGARSAVYCKLDARTISDDGALIGVVFDLHSSKVDGDDSFQMVPPSYLPTDAIASSEHWTQSRALLRQLRSATV